MPARHQRGAERGVANLMIGVRIARERSVVGRLLVGMALFSFLSLPYVGALPDGRADQLRRRPRARTAGCTPPGGSARASVHSRSARCSRSTDKRKLVAPFMVAFGVALLGFALLRSAGPAFPVGFVLGFFYFALATSMLTVVQQNLQQPRAGAGDVAVVHGVRRHRRR